MKMEKTNLVKFQVLLKIKKIKPQKNIICDTINYIPMELTTGNKLRKTEFNDGSSTPIEASAGYSEKIKKELVSIRTKGNFGLPNKNVSLLFSKSEEWNNSKQSLDMPVAESKSI